MQNFCQRLILNGVMQRARLCDGALKQTVAASRVNVGCIKVRVLGAYTLSGSEHPHGIQGTQHLTLLLFCAFVGR